MTNGEKFMHRLLHETYKVGDFTIYPAQIVKEDKIETKKESACADPEEPRKVTN